MALFTEKNFIDYGKVKEDGDHIDRFFEPVDTAFIDTVSEDPHQRRVRIVEHRVSLQDHKFQLFTKAETFSMLNLDKLSIIEIPLGKDPNAYFTYLFDLSQEIKVENRVVEGFFDLFGEIGGLREVFVSVIMIFIGSVQSKAFLFNKARTMYRFHVNDDE